MRLPQRARSSCYAAGYQLFDPEKTYAAGDKIYFVQDNKAIVAAAVGTPSFEFRL